MRISHKYKYIFIAVPKTGSESVRAALNPVSDIKSNGETLYHYHKTYASALKDFDYTKDYKCFGFGRNPWSRAVSFWKHIVKSAQYDTPYGRQARSKLKSGKNCDKNFKSFVLNSGLINPCTHWLSSDGKNIDINFTGKIENLTEDFNKICDKIGIPPQQLPHVNKTKHKHYTEYYDDETKQIVAEKYAKDIEYFGYEFGE